MSEQVLLWGGPFDGNEYALPEEGPQVVKIPSAPSAIVEDEAGEMEVTYEHAWYERTDWVKPSGSRVYKFTHKG